MGLIKTLLKLGTLLAVIAAVAGVIYVVRRPRDGAPVSFEEWPNVPHNPDA